MSPGKNVPDIFTVSRLNTEIRATLDGSFPLLWVQGEISNLATPRSGHLYFTLKDSAAQIRCAMFRQRRNLLRFNPRDGDQILLRARISYYETRGECQLQVEHMEPAGQGDLRQQFELLKRKLQAEGLFDLDRKLRIPPRPIRIGVISSPSGAAIHDVLQVLQRRAPWIPVLIYPSVVQGAEAPESLTEALRLAIARSECDVLLLTRGGGSLEDLSAFNDENLARLIADCPIPLVSAVGHEIDVTISDLVADLRAPTPSAAAELLSPDRDELEKHLWRIQTQLRRALGIRSQNLREVTRTLANRLQRMHPLNRMRQGQLRLDELEVRLDRQFARHLAGYQSHIANFRRRLAWSNPGRQLPDLKRRVAGQRSRLARSTQRSLRIQEQSLHAALGRLQTVSPLATLARGYAVVRRAENNAIIRAAEEVKPGDDLAVKLARGQLLCSVNRVLPADRTEEPGPAKS